MAISSISSNNLYYTYLNKSESDESSSSVADAVLAKVSSAKNSAYSAYASNMYSGEGQAAMLKAVEAIREENGGGKVTFDMVKKYRDGLESEFETTIQAGLALLGFKESAEFQMTATTDGQIAVLCNDPEVKAAVEFLMQESPKLSEHFLYIQALGNIERAQGTLNAKSQMQNSQTSLAADAVDILLNNSGTLSQFSGVGYSSLTANYSESQIQYILGANYTV